jgi:hypothetical protein
VWRDAIPPSSNSVIKRGNFPPRGLDYTREAELGTREGYAYYWVSESTMERISMIENRIKTICKIRVRLALLFSLAVSFLFGFLVVIS